MSDSLMDKGSTFGQDLSSRSVGLSPEPSQIICILHIVRPGCERHRSL